MRERLNIAVNYIPPARKFDFFIWIEHSDSRRSFADNILMKEIPDGVMPEHCMSIDKQAAQQLMDELYRCGLRPTQAKKDDEALAAKNEHIGDLRHISFALLDKVTKDV